MRVQRGALIQHDPELIAIADELSRVQLEYIDPASLDSASCVNLMLARKYDFVMPCLSMHSYLAFRLAEVAHAAALDTRVIMFTALPNPVMLRLFDGVLEEPLSTLGVRTFAECMARPVRRLPTREAVDEALREVLLASHRVRVDGYVLWDHLPTLADYRKHHHALRWGARH